MPASSATAPDLLSVFNALPGAYLLLSPDLIIEAASDVRLTVTLTTRESLLGRYLFDAFPDNPQAPETSGVRNLQASLAQVLATGQPHEMARQRYDIPDPDNPGQFIERYWLPRNTAVPDAQGRVLHLIHAVTDVTDAVKTEVRLRETQLAEQAARADAEGQRQRFYDVLMQLPAQVATYHGPDHVFTFINQRFSALVAAQSLLGRPVREASRGAVGPEVFAALDRVYVTGEPAHLQELEVTLDRHDSTQTEPLFVNAFYLPLRGALGQINGVLDFSYDVTEQVVARQQLQQLNAELETRVQERTAQLSQQQGLLQQILGQAPAAIATLSGPEHRYTFFNDRYQAMSAGRPQLGRSVAEAHPEVVAQGVINLLDNVYATGQPFVATEMSVQLHNATSGRLEQRYLDYIYQPLPDEHGQTTGMLVFVLDVTEKVQTRQQTETLQADALAATQRQAQEREAFYQVFEQTPAAICIQRGPEHRYEYLNAAYQQFFPERQLLGRPVAEVLPETVEAGIVALLDNVYQTGETYFGHEVPLLVAQPEGRPQQMYFTFTYQAYRENGEIVGISTFAYDVAEQVRLRQQTEEQQVAALAAARHQAQEREAFYQIFEQTPALIVLLRAPGHHIDYVNPAYQALFPNRQLVGFDLADALPELRDQGFSALMDHVYQTGETYFGREMPFVMPPTPDWSSYTAYFNFTYQAYRENGRIAGISIFAYEVTEQVLARQERETLQRQLSGLFMQAPAPICILDGPDLVYQLINPAYQQIFPGRDLLNKALLEALPELAGTPIPAILDQVFQTGETYVAHEMPLMIARHQDSPLEEIYVTFTYQARRNGQGTVDGVLVFAHEVTDQVRARRVVEESERQAQAMADELSAANRQLTRTNVDLDNFIYTASHDLKAPITNIEGLLHALLAELPPTNPTSEVVQPILDMMQGAVDRFKQTINHLTEVSRLQQEHTQPPEQVELAAVIEGVRLDLLPLLTEANAHLDVAVDDCPALTFPVKNLRSVVYNLLSNALKYRHPDRAPRVRIHCQREAGRLLLRVEDNGLGLDKPQRARLFGLFQRLHTHVEGSGIGLYMVKKIVENAGGKIEVESEAGVGSVFTVSFPI